MIVSNKKYQAKSAARVFLILEQSQFDRQHNEMSLKRINAILWRKYLAATSSALWKLSKSQYYFELAGTEPDYDQFFGDKATASQDERGNSLFTIQLEPFEGHPSVEAYELKFTKLRDVVERAGDWQVHQSGENAYALWRASRGPLKSFQDMDEAERKLNFIVIVRDVDGRFHGRWIPGDEFHSLPVAIQNLLISKNVGWSNL
jgi:hypothetical protein